MFEYFLLFKTATAEFRAWRNLDQSYKANISVIAELTRGRKKRGLDKDLNDNQLRKKPGAYGFQKIVSQLKEEFSDCRRLILDLTREPSLTCYEISDLTTSTDGYNSWTSFAIGLSKNIPGLVPTLLVNPQEGETEDKYARNLVTQFDKFSENFSSISYRAAVLLDPEFEYDLEILSDKINQFIATGNKFFIEFDHEYVRPGSGAMHAIQSIDLINRVAKLLPGATLIILSSSFPRNIGDIGNEESDAFPQEEVRLFQDIQKAVSSNIRLNYGDYGSINPVRNDQIARGWRPRIDFPTRGQRTFYHREKRKKYGKGKEAIYNSYASHYASVAKSVKDDPRFENIENSWGVLQILEAADGKPPGSSPSYWISVRMEIHIIQQIRRLKRS